MLSRARPTRARARGATLQSRAAVDARPSPRLTHPTRAPFLTPAFPLLATNPISSISRSYFATQAAAGKAPAASATTPRSRPLNIVAQPTETAKGQAAPAKKPYSYSKSLYSGSSAQDEGSDGWEAGQGSSAGGSTAQYKPQYSKGISGYSSSSYQKQAPSQGGYPARSSANSYSTPKSTAGTGQWAKQPQYSQQQATPYQQPSWSPNRGARQSTGQQTGGKSWPNAKPYRKASDDNEAWPDYAPGQDDYDAPLNPPSADSAPHSASEPRWSSLIAEKNRAKDYPGALQVWQELKSANVTPDAFACTTIITTYKALHQFDNALKVAKFMREKKMKLNDISANQIVDVFAKNNDIKGMIAILNEMQAEHLDVKPWAMAALLKSYRDTESEDLLNHIITQLQRGSIDPSDVAVQTLFGHKLNAASASSDTDAFVATLEQMKGLNMKVAPYQRVQLVGLYARLGQIDKMEAMANEIEASADPATNLATMYRHLIYGFAEIGDMFKAKDTMARMKARGVQADLKTQTALLYFFINVGFYKEARETIAEIKSQGPLTPSIVGPMMRLYALTGDVSAAEELVAEVKQQGVRLSTIAFNSLLELYASTGDMAKTKQIEAEAKKASDNNGLNALAYTALLRIYAEQGLAKEAKRVFAEMEQNIATPPVTAISSALTAFLEESKASGVSKEAKEFFEEQKKKYPNAVFLMLKTLVDWTQKNKILQEHSEYKAELDSLMAVRG